jgi:hypothetical protein
MLRLAGLVGSRSVGSTGAGAVYGLKTLGWAAPPTGGPPANPGGGVPAAGPTGGPPAKPGGGVAVLGGVGGVAPDPGPPFS